MKIAGSTLLYSRLSLDEACQRLSGLGFDAIDIGMQEGWAHECPSDAVGAVEETVQRIENACAAADLDPVAINAGTNNVGLDVEIVQIEAIADVADAIGVEVITLPAASSDKPLEDDIERFRALESVVLDRDVSLTVETHWGTHTEDPTVATAYAASVPSIGYTLDPGHFFIGDHDTTPPYRDILPNVEHVHIRQVGTGWEEIQQPVEDGSIDIETFVDDLRRASYKGVITVEYIDSLDGVDPQEAQQHAAEMRELLLEQLR